MHVFAFDIKLTDLCANLSTTSAGVPLTYYHVNDSALSIENLTKKFLTITFSSTEKNTYRKNGFYPYITLNEIFKNAYTQTNDEKLQVRAMKAEDVYNVTGMSALEEGGTDFKNGKYNELLVFGTDYWLATAYNDYNLWRVVNDGRIYALSNREYGIRPVVSLKTTIKTTGYNLESIWNIQL